MEKLNPRTVALSLASVLTLISLACAILFILAPTFTLGFFNNIFNGTDLTKIAKTSLPMTNVIIGLIEVFIASLIIGWLFTIIYNRLSK